jgi:hypothetical protein
MKSNTSGGRRGRWARLATAGLTAATAIMLAAVSAQALPPGNDDPPPPPSTGDLVISGTVSLTNCPGVTRDHVTVLAVPTNPNSDAGGVVRASSTGAYRITDLPGGVYNVVPRLDPGLCKYGAGWNPASRQVSVFTTSKTGVNFTYRGPVQVLRLPATSVAAALNAAVQGTGLHLDNFGPLHGQSHQLDNGSSLRLGGISFPFTLAEKQYDLDCGLLCPDLGQARFYVNDLDLTSINVGWASPSFRATLAFESGGREVKGFYTDATTGIVSDSLMPDFNIDNARLNVALTPSALDGSLTYRVSSVDLSASIQPTGACDFFGVDPCVGLLGDYKTTIKSEFQNRVRAKLSDPAVRTIAANLLKPSITDLGMPRVDRVYIEGDEIVLAV